MLTRIDLHHFKCFELLRLPLSPLTLLTGLNSSGKSSVLQALALLNQTMREHEWSTHLQLNGEVVRLGSALDVIDEETSRNNFTIAIESGDIACEWEFYSNRQDMSPNIDDSGNIDYWPDDFFDQFDKDANYFAGWGERYHS